MLILNTWHVVRLCFHRCGAIRPEANRSEISCHDGFVTGHDVTMPLFLYLDRQREWESDTDWVCHCKWGRLSGYIVSVQGKAFGYSRGCAYRKWCRHVLGSMGDPFTSESHLLSCTTTLACPGRDRIMRIAISVTLKFHTLQFLLRKSGIFCVPAV